jgi:hypothetical protein
LNQNGVSSCLAFSLSSNIRICTSRLISTFVGCITFVVVIDGSVSVFSSIDGRFVGGTAGDFLCNSAFGCTCTCICGAVRARTLDFDEFSFNGVVGIDDDTCGNLGDLKRK